MRWAKALVTLLLFIWLATGFFGAVVYFIRPAKGAEMLELHKGDLDLLGRVIWAEARSEPFEGQCAIAWVILNRLMREPGRFPATVQGVIHQPFAFSCFNTKDPQCAKVKVVDERDPAFVAAMHAATSVLLGKVPSPIGRADHYFRTDMRDPPTWARKMTLVKRLGSHSFFSEKPAP